MHKSALVNVQDCTDWSLMNQMFVLGSIFVARRKVLCRVSAQERGTECENRGLVPGELCSQIRGDFHLVWESAAGAEEAQSSRSRDWRRRSDRGRSRRSRTPERSERSQPSSLSPPPAPTCAADGESSCAQPRICLAASASGPCHCTCWYDGSISPSACFCAVLASEGALEDGMVFIPAKTALE